MNSCLYLGDDQSVINQLKMRGARLRTNSTPFIGAAQRPKYDTATITSPIFSDNDEAREVSAVPYDDST